MLTTRASLTGFAPALLLLLLLREYPPLSLSPHSLEVRTRYNDDDSEIRYDDGEIRHTADETRHNDNGNERKMCACMCA